MKARLPEGFGGKAQNMNSMIKQAQKMQEEMEKAQEEIKAKEYTTTVGGGARRNYDDRRQGAQIHQAEA